MRDRILEVNQEMVNKLTNISGNYEKYDGTLLDNYIFTIHKISELAEVNRERSFSSKRNI